MCAFGTGEPPRGIALVIAMLVMGVLLLAGTTFLTISSTESQIALNERAAAQAFLLAEAAVHKAIAQLYADSGYTGETNTALGGGTFTVSVATSATQPCVGATAKDVAATAVVPVGGAQARVQLQVTVDRISYPFGWGVFAAVPDGIVTGDRREKELWLKEVTTSDSFDSSLGPYDATTNAGNGGSVGANGDGTLDRNVRVSGNVTAGDTIHADSGVTVTGTRSSGFPVQNFPSVTPSTTPTGGLTVGNNQTYNLPAGTYYYISITFGNNSSLTTSGGPVTIYVTGEVTIGNSVTLGTYPGTRLQIITSSDLPNDQSSEFSAGNSFQLYGSLYGKSTDINVGNDAQIYGSIVGRAISIGNTGAVHFDQAMADRELCHSGKFSIRRGTWREVIPS